MSSSIPFITIEPRAPHTHTLIFLHGRGDNARNFASSLLASRTSQNTSLIDSFPSFRFVFPQAPLRDVSSEAGIKWNQWFDVWNVRDFSDNEQLQSVGLKEVVPEIQKIIYQEAVTLDGRWDKVFLAGISMGAATSVHVLFNLDGVVPPGTRLGGFLGFSCRCPFAGRDLGGMRQALGLQGAEDGAKNGVLRGTPVLLEHCVDDPLVLVQSGRGLRDTLRGFEMEVEWKEYPNGGHWFNSPMGMDDAVEFLRRRVGEGN